ncbi:hypothetical protein Tco_1028948 [Tanacetum coccineum]|uniref:Uncharacterized protein n=1 Tax=Tanacetum coccineum TaxID=301880 RepID=A0ABQ5G224_9ASTR
MVSIGGSLTPYYGLDRRSRSVVFPSEGFQSKVSIRGFWVARSERYRGFTPFVKVLNFESYFSFPDEMIPMLTLMLLWNQCMPRIARRSADALPTIAHAEVPHSRNHVKSPQTQDTNTEGAPSDRGVTEGRDATMNKLNDDTELNEGFLDDGFDDDDKVRNTAGDKIGKELLHFAPSPYYMQYPYDEVPTATQLLKVEGLTLKELSDRMNVLMCLRFLMKEQTLIIVHVNKHGAQLPGQVEHLSGELANPKWANHALEKANHSRFKKYKKYNVEKDYLVLEKEKLENELLEIRATSKQDKESFAKAKSQLDLQETELGDQKHQPSIEQSETHKLKNAIIENERDLFEDSSKRTSRDLFKNSSIVAISPKHLLVSSPWRESAPTKDHIITPGKILYHRSGGGYELTRESTPTKDYTITVGEFAPTKGYIITLGKILYYHFGGGYEMTREYVPTKDYIIILGKILYHRSRGGYELTRESAPTKDYIITRGKILYHRSGGGYGLTREFAPTKDCTITLSPLSCLNFQLRNVVMVYVHSATDVASHLVAYTRKRKGGYSRPSVAESISKDIPTRKRSEEPLSPLLEGSGASSDGRTTLKKKVCSSHSFHQKDGSACIVLDKRITEHAHEVKAIGCDSNLLGENQGWSLSENRADESINSEQKGWDHVLLWLLVIYEDPLEELLLSLLRGGLPEEHSNLRIALCLMSGLLALTLPPEETPLPYLLRRLMALTLPLEETAGPYLSSWGDCWPLPSKETAGHYLMRRLLLLTS